MAASEAVFQVVPDPAWRLLAACRTKVHLQYAVAVSKLGSLQSAEDYHWVWAY